MNCFLGGKLTDSSKRTCAHRKKISNVLAVARRFASGITVYHPSSPLIETLSLPHLSRPNTRKTSRTSRTDVDRFHIRNQKSHEIDRNTTLINKSDVKAKAVTVILAAQTV